ARRRRGLSGGAPAPPGARPLRVLTVRAPRGTHLLAHQRVHGRDPAADRPLVVPDLLRLTAGAGRPGAVGGHRPDPRSAPSRHPAGAPRRHGPRPVAAAAHRRALAPPTRDLLSWTGAGGCMRSPARGYDPSPWN